MKIALISCTKDKKDFPCRAVEIYSKSHLFSKALDYINTYNYDQMYILSAKHGLLHPEEIIEPYNVTLNNMKVDEIRAWSQKVFSQIKGILQGDKAILHFYTGERYRKYLIPLLEYEGNVCTVPLKGLGLGEQLQFYNQNTHKFK